MFTQELRLASDYDGRFQWVLGGFYSDIQRDYGQTLPTPGYDAIMACGWCPLREQPGARRAGRHAVLLAHSVRLRADGGFSPKASFDITERFNATLGGALLRLRGRARPVLRGAFADRIVDPNTGETISLPGVRQRTTACCLACCSSYDVIENVQLNAQAAEGFRLGGINDPLNIPLCSAEDVMHLRRPRQLRERVALELRARREVRLRRRPRPVQYLGVLRRHLRPADAGRCGHLLVAYRLQRARSALDRRRDGAHRRSRPTASTSASRRATRRRSSTPPSPRRPVA